MEELPEFSMLPNKKRSLGITNNSDALGHYHTWEEEAFAGDAAGPYGAFIWPPRSYCCSFCGREFRSAQALGGHMNVHRWDRARLKQLSSFHQTRTDLHHHQHHQVQRDLAQKNPSQSYLISSRSDSVSIRVFSILDQGEKVSKDICVNHDKSAGLDVMVGAGKEGNFTCKRQRMDGLPISYLLKTSFISKTPIRSEIMGLKIGKEEELDLELRLGDRPMVK